MSTIYTVVAENYEGVGEIIKAFKNDIKADLYKQELEILVKAYSEEYKIYLTGYFEHLQRLEITNERNADDNDLSFNY